MLPVLTPTDFVALANQTFEMAFQQVEIEGEVLNFKVSKNRWVYFDISDEQTKLRCFGTVYILPGPIEDGMRVIIRCAPRLHAQFGFSLQIQTIQLSGEGTIKKAAHLLAAKLESEGLFATERKRQLPYPPSRIGLITSFESAAYKDFIKVLSARFGGIHIELADVQVQGTAAPGQLVRAIDWFNRTAQLADVLVIIRGGGSSDDLQAYSSEQVTRAVASSRIPTLVAIGHEVDISLAELAADMRASTPSNAAELLVPDRKTLLNQLETSRNQLDKMAKASVESHKKLVVDRVDGLYKQIHYIFTRTQDAVVQQLKTLEALSPQATLRRGYVIIRKHKKVIYSSTFLKTNDDIALEFADGSVAGKVQ